MRSDKDLSGRIPGSLGRLEWRPWTSSGNDLSRPLPAELAKLTNLTVPGLNDNALSGSIPPEFYDLPLAQRSRNMDANLPDGNPLLANIR